MRLEITPDARTRIIVSGYAGMPVRVTSQRPVVDCTVNGTRISLFATDARALAYALTACADEVDRNQ